MTDPMVSFCAARERLRTAEHESRDERAEQNDAQRTLSGLLLDSMQRHQVACVAVPATEALPGGGYVYLPPPTRRACALKTPQDVMPLLRDITRTLTDVAEADLPDAVSRAVLRRAREQGELRPARPRVQARPPRQSVVHVPPNETKRLSEQFATAVEECRDTRRRLKPLRDAVRESERNVLRTVPATTQPTQVQMQRPDGTSGVLHISRAERPRRASLGVREVCRVVKEVTARLLAEGVSRTLLDARLGPEVEKVLTERPAPTTTPRLRVRMERRRGQIPGNLPE